MQSKKPNRAIAKFQREIRLFYRSHRRDFPWRKTRNPYRIFVSEIMLQQTQTDRVVPKYREFIRCFPSWKKLSEAPLRKVLQLWSGLGYNRRAKYLHDAASVIVKLHHGRLPRSHEELLTLPGVGEYTAQAILAFSFNKPSICLETNIRTVFINYFFRTRTKVHDKEIQALLSRTLPAHSIREWYYALMDKGASLKRANNSMNLKSVHYTKQSRFKGSRREVRGAILSLLVQGKHPSTNELSQTFGKSSMEIGSIIDSLVRDKLIKKTGKRLMLP